MTSVVIGLEIHAYLDTKSKLFCSCPTSGSEEPNSLCCEQCLGHPGSKPVLNEKAVEFATKIGLALNCNINKDFFFSRKTYFYPDMAANYQITQYEVPVAENGCIELNGKKIRVKRAHLEIDPAALIHPSGMGSSNYSLIDYNRSGLPLVEIVTEPDLTSPKEAREFLKTLENILFYLKVLKPETTLKVDCNVSIDGGHRVEIKNISGFAAAEKALNYEIARLKKEKELGQKGVMHTRAYNADKGITIEVRTKETEEDYGYIFDPDLTKVSLDQDYIDMVKESIPELPKQKAKRLQKDYDLSELEANTLCSDFELGELFVELVEKDANPKITARLLTRDLLAVLNHDSLSLKDIDVSVNALYDLTELIEQNKVSDKNVKKSVINYVSGSKESPKDFLEKNKLLIDESIDLDSIISSVLEANTEAIDEYKKGNEKVLNFLAGQIMRETKGSANIKQVLEKLKEKLV